MNKLGSDTALLEGRGEIIKADGTVIPITLRAETSLSLNEVRERTGIDVKEKEK